MPCDVNGLGHCVRVHASQRRLPPSLYCITAQAVVEAKPAGEEAEGDDGKKKKKGKKGEQQSRIGTSHLMQLAFTIACSCM